MSETNEEWNEVTEPLCSKEQRELLYMFFDPRRGGSGRAFIKSLTSKQASLIIDAINQGRAKTPVLDEPPLKDDPEIIAILMA